MLRPCKGFQRHTAILTRSLLFTGVTVSWGNMTVIVNQVRALREYGKAT